LVPKHKRARFVALAHLLARRRPDVELSAIADGRVLVDGRVLTNPFAQVRLDAALRVLTERRLRGDRKLSDALDAMSIDVDGLVAVDIGANVGGFTTALLDRGVGRVYAVEAGSGLLLGRLRSDPRVINLERHNLGRLDSQVVPEPVELITVDVSYLSVAAVLPQLGRLTITDATSLVALVKPTFELRRGTLASTNDDLESAIELASAAAARCGWRVVDACETLEPGRRGAREAFIHARRRT
jgi:23S rRNA (cytidine1920-2'-O)/16S rRNA (cytidine1409-2'-O)-methyltransferase